MSKLGSAYCANNVAVRLNPFTSANKLWWVSATSQRAALMAVGIMIEIDSAVAVKRNV